MRGKTHVGLHDGNLTLLHDQHGYFFHAEQERIEVVRAVKQGVVLETDLAAQIQKFLKVLIGAVPVVLAAENGLEEPRVRRRTLGGGPLQRFDICKSAKAARDVARRQRFAFQGRDDADHVDDFTGLGGTW